MSGDAAAVEVRIDGKRCCGAGHCARLVPAVFDQDERDGTVILLQVHPPRSLSARIHEAAALCPTSAILLGVQA